MYEIGIINSPHLTDEETKVQLLAQEDRVSEPQTEHLPRLQVLTFILLPGSATIEYMIASLNNPVR